MTADLASRAFATVLFGLGTFFLFWQRNSVAEAAHRYYRKIYRKSDHWWEKQFQPSLLVCRVMVRILTLILLGLTIASVMGYTT